MYNEYSHCCDYPGSVTLGTSHNIEQIQPQLLDFGKVGLLSKGY